MGEVDYSIQLKSADQVLRSIGKTSISTTELINILEKQRDEQILDTFHKVNYLTMQYNRELSFLRQVENGLPSDDIKFNERYLDIARLVCEGFSFADEDALDLEKTICHNCSSYETAICRQGELEYANMLVLGTE